MDVNQSELVITDKHKMNEVTYLRLVVAAKLRVEGNSWDTVAPIIGRKNGDSARQIVGQYGAAWRKAYEEARHEYLDGVEAEAVMTMRRLMNCGQAAIEERAAYGVLRHCSNLRAKKIEHTSVPYETNKAPEEMSTQDIIKLGLYTRMRARREQDAQ